MHDLARLLDDDMPDTELGALLDRLKHDAGLRDQLSTQQLVSDSLAGLRSLDAGYSLRILAKVKAS
jgi:negative regulator of sigma E activity